MTVVDEIKDNMARKLIITETELRKITKEEIEKQLNNTMSYRMEDTDEINEYMWLKPNLTLAYTIVLVIFLVLVSKVQKLIQKFKERCNCLIINHLSYVSCILSGQQCSEIYNARHCC